MVGKFFREPLVHFLLIGAGLFLLFGWRSGPSFLPAGPSGSPSTKIVVAQDEIDQTMTTFTKTWQRPPTEEEAKGLVEDLVRNEIYYREAMAIGLDRDDGVIRRRMRQKMEFILEDISAQTEPTDEELLAYMKKHPDSFLVDPQVAFRHVYVNVDKRGKNAETDALQILAKLNEGSNPDTLGDPILLDTEIKLSPRWDIKKQFGEEFSRNLLDLKSGKWEGPVRSGYGLHLVLVEKRVGGRLPELKEVREMVKRDLMAERQKALKDAAYAKIRERYTVVVEKTNADKISASTVVGGGAQK
ncbi:MAG: peptidyl-prolyl cis-trans isomerase [Deltaproteobacteria bacterium]|nr:MAG: peptidyl-prolyl cis-trans isomerase [Deltaproteobacteria bacterium]